jgi:bifunctional UDP-N-acetylglucosamine pyrophosphorylase/glucosamine-1-phosphate N-acetyltransferase
MAESIGIVVLAAGKGTRLKQKTPKPLLKILGKTLVQYVLDASEKFIKNKSLEAQISVVVGHKSDEVIASFGETNYHFPLQKEQNGTAGALISYFDNVAGAWEQDYTMVLCADTPLITNVELEKLFNELGSNTQAVGATFKVDNPHGLGRIIRDDIGFKIVEEKDCTDLQREITEVNSAQYIIRTSYLKKYLKAVDNRNASGEFYLTDVFKTSENVKAFYFEDANTFLGINTLNQLESITNLLKQKKNNTLMNNGVNLMSCATTFIDFDVKIGEDTVIYPNVHIWGNTIIGNNVRIQPGCVIENSVIEDGAIIKANSTLENAKVCSNASIGPFTRLRPGAEIGEESKIGNFVEIKKSILSRGVKVSHLSYIGDAQIGEESNIGCGFITCNYDGANKHVTKIGSGAFIGSDCQAIAPVTIGNDSFVAAGSTITNDISDGGFAIARSKQITKKDMASKFIKNKK